MYRPVKDQLTKEFGQAVHELDGVLHDFRNVLNETIASGDAEHRDAVQKRLLNRFLHPFGVTLEMCTFDYIRTEGEDNPEYGMDDIDSTFKARIAFFKQSRISLLTTGYSELMKLSYLCGFNFPGLLNFFVKGQGKEDEPPRMIPCTGAKIVDLLEDIYFITANLSLTKTGMNLLRMLQTLDGGLVPSEDRLVQAYAKIQRIRDLFLANEILLDVIRAIKLDPFYVCEYDRKNTNFVKEIYSGLVTSYRNNRSDYQKTADERRFSEQIAVLFDNDGLISVRGYDENTDKILRDTGLGSLQYINALKILKTFGERQFTGDMVKSVKALFEIADFNSAGFKRSLMNSFQSCRDSFDLLHRLEADLNDHEFSPILPVLQATQASSPTDKHRAKLSAPITALNKQVDGLLQSALKAHRSLMNDLLRFIKEVRRGDNEAIANARYLTVAHGDFLQEIEHTSTKIYRFITIMENSVVNIADAKKRIDKS